MNLKKKLIPVLIAPIFVGLTFSGHALANESDELEKLRQLANKLWSVDVWMGKPTRKGNRLWIYRRMVANRVNWNI